MHSSWRTGGTKPEIWCNLLTCGAGVRLTKYVEEPAPLRGSARWCSAGNLETDRRFRADRA